MASTSIRTRLFKDESLSLRSFRVNVPPSSTPSLKASSLKLPRSLSFATKSNRRVLEPTIQDLISRPSNEDITCFDMGLPPPSSDVQQTTMNSPGNAHTEQVTLHHPWSKPRTIIRMLTTKFNPRFPTSSAVVSRVTVPSGPNAFSKESREAALRERGLLPPLKSNKDLSAQEKEQDKAIPIVLTDDTHISPEADTLTAAGLIKKEWESKNRSLESAQLQRMNSFKFGGLSPVPGSPVTPKEFSSESADSSVPDIPAPEPLPSLPVELAVPQPLYSQPVELAVPQPLYSQPSSLSAPLLSPGTVLISKPSSRPATPLLDIPRETAAYLYPLPPSPRSVTRPNFDLSSRPSSPTSVPLPPSPSLRSVFDATSLRSASGVCIPKPLDIQETLTPTPTPPVISLTPCAVISPDSASEDAISSPLHSTSSTQTPSLDSNSHTTTDSTLGTSESAAISGKGRLGGLRIKTHEGNNIPVIVESPIEDSFLEERDVVVEATSTFDGNQAVPATAPISGNEAKSLLSALPMKRRVQTDPTNSNLDRKKSMIINPFKRGSSAYGDHSITSSGEPQRRLSVKASLSNMRRSVVGTLSRKSISGENGGGGGGKMFDASHLPPSPILPSTFSNNLHSPTPPSFRTGGELSARTAVSPTLYSRGHILMEASHIKDEESRRMTEMAFLT